MSRHGRCNCHWADRLIPVRSTDLFENPRFITQNSPAKISRLATAAGEATAHPITTRMPRMDTNKSVREIDGHKFPGYRLHLTPVRHQRSPSNAPAHRPRASDIRLATATQSRGSVQPVSPPSSSWFTLPPHLSLVTQYPGPETAATYPSRTLSPFSVSDANMINRLAVRANPVKSTVGKRLKTRIHNLETSVFCPMPENGFRA